MKVKNPRNLNIYIFVIQELQFTRMSVMDEGTKLMDDSNTMFCKTIRIVFKEL